MKRQSGSSYDVDAEVDRRKLERYERGDMNPDEYRRMKYGVDGTKIFVCQAAPGVFTIKMLGKTQSATDINKIVAVISEGIRERFGL